MQMPRSGRDRSRAMARSRIGSCTVFTRAPRSQPTPVIDPTLAGFETIDARVGRAAEERREAHDFAGLFRVASGSPHFDDGTPPARDALGRAPNEPVPVVQHDLVRHVLGTGAQQAGQAERGCYGAGLRALPRGSRPVRDQRWRENGRPCDGCGAGTLTCMGTKVAVINSNEDLIIELLRIVFAQAGLDAVAAYVPDIKRGREDLLSFVAQHEPAAST